MEVKNFIKKLEREREQKEIEGARGNVRGGERERAE